MLWNEDTYSGWGRVLNATGRIARPERLSHLSALLGEQPMPAIGNRRSYGDAALNSRGPVLDMTRLDRLIEFDAKTGLLEAEAGVTIGDLVRVFAPQGWIPAVVPGTGYATLGGCIANDVHGKNHHEAGSFGQHVQSLRLIGADGKSRLISPKREAKVFRATLGGLGQTGVILSARIQMLPCTSEHMEVRETRMDGLSDFLAALYASTAPWSVGWLDATASGAALGRGVLEEGRFADQPGPSARGSGASVPFDAPSFLLAAPVVKAFNALYFRRIPEAGRTRIRPLESFFFPLDKLRGWNRLYGKRGFYQFQCVLPETTAAITLDTMLRDIAGSGLAAPLAVLKRMGAGRAGPMSFPMEGCTLAVDFPNREAALELINRLEDQVLDAGGRIYLAKDALSTAACIEAMYPELPEFRATLKAVDPEAQFETDLSRRLNLRGEA